MLLVSIIGALVCIGILWALFADCDVYTRLAYIPKNFYFGKVIWITGASSGIGKSLCEQLAHLGAHLIISARNESTLESMASSLDELGASSVYVLPIDLSHGAEVVHEAASKALGYHGRLDVLVNNAGVGTRASSAALEMDAMHRLMETNVFAPVQLARVCLPALTESRGIIINTSSMLQINY